MSTELVVNLTTLKQDYVDAGNQIVQYYMLESYFKAFYYIKQSWHCI